ncbi:MAG: GGDEF domain-containing protein [Clostridia bacterium]|nr:GGDEF domain-containing protein [Clostridia bacterium]MBP5428785.1 GGDEF domain-containing protein [Clostridia bacterium]
MKKDKTTGGVRLRIMNYVTGGLAVGLAVLMLTTTFLAVDGYYDLQDTTDVFIECRESANEIQKASDYLTEHVRYFVGSGMKQYVDLYFREAKETRRREKGLETLGKFFADTELYEDLKQAVERSYSLMDLEYHAMRLRLETIDGVDFSEYPAEVRDYPLSDEERGWDVPKQMDESRKLVYDEEYEAYKSGILAEINSCLAGLENKLKEQRAHQTEQVHVLIVLERVLIVLAATTVALLVTLTSFMVFHPLIRAEQLIRSEKLIPEERGAYEFRFFASTYNRMFEASKESKERLAFKASHDYLTGIFNRSGLDRYLDRAAAGRNALVLVDLDGFKGVNDTYGHDVGDKILKKLSGKLSSSFRSDDRICRIGGDEFAVIMWNAGVESSDMIREKIALINSEMRESSDDLPPVSISAGVAFGGEGTRRDLFRRADRELYRVKRAGGCGISVRDGSLPDEDDAEFVSDDEIDK